MKTTLSSIKKVICAAAIISVVGMSVFASPKSSAKAEPKVETSIQTPDVSIPKTATLKTIRGKVKVSKKDNAKVLTFKSISNRKYSITVVAPLTEEELVDVKNKKIYLSGYVDDETKEFYVIKIGHLPSNGEDGNAK